jgi:hypothetical protein
MLREIYRDLWSPMPGLAAPRLALRHALGLQDVTDLSARTLRPRSSG